MLRFASVGVVRRAAAVRGVCGVTPPHSPYGEEREWKTTDEEIEARKMPVPTVPELMEAYTFDDVALVPKYSTLTSRMDPSLETWLTSERKIAMPLLASNMDTVMGDDIAEVLVENGGMPIMHRFCSLDQQVEWCKKFADNMFISAGFNDYDNLGPCFDAGAAGVCLDVAHGHTSMMIDMIKHVKENYPDKLVMAGNISSPLGLKDLVEAGADAVKTGVGPGAACSTRKVTGFGIPQFSAIQSTADLGRKMGVPVVADGGIRNSRDVVLALAAGATTVMVGNLFAKTYESAAPKYLRVRTESNHHVVYPVRVNVPTKIEFEGSTYDFTLGSTKPNEVPFKFDVFAMYRGTFLPFFLLVCIPLHCTCTPLTAHTHHHCTPLTAHHAHHITPPLHTHSLHTSAHTTTAHLCTHHDDHDHDHDQTNNTRAHTHHRTSFRGIPDRLFRRRQEGNGGRRNRLYYVGHRIHPGPHR